MNTQVNGEDNSSKERGSKQIKDATLYDANKPSVPEPLIAIENDDMEEYLSTENFGTDPEEIEETGNPNMEAIKLDEKAVAEICDKQDEDDIKREELRSATEMYGNGANEWRLIQKTYNNNLDWEHVTTAMQIGTRGIIVHVKEAVGQKVNATSVFIQNGLLQEIKGKWFIK